jgi:hypothetical protein
MPADEHEGVGTGLKGVHGPKDTMELRGTGGAGMVLRVVMNAETITRTSFLGYSVH